MRFLLDSVVIIDHFNNIAAATNFFCIDSLYLYKGKLAPQKPGISVKNPVSYTIPSPFFCRSGGAHRNQRCWVPLHGARPTKNSRPRNREFL
jgi:hypothetical protein